MSIHTTEVETKWDEWALELRADRVIKTLIYALPVLRPFLDMSWQRFFVFYDFDWIGQEQRTCHLRTETH